MSSIPPTVSRAGASFPLAPISPFTSSIGAQFGNFSDPASQPGQFPLSIDFVVFATSECPDKLEFGLSTTVHLSKLIGGGLPATVFGTYPEPVTWTGRIRANNVDKRIAALQHIQRAQREVIITHRTDRWYCYISSFKWTRLTVDVEYSITVQVTRSAAGVTTGAALVSVDTQVTSLISQASGYGSNIGAIDPAGAIPLQAAVGDVTSAVAAAGPIAQLTGGPLNSVLNTVNAAIATAKTYAAKLSPVAAQFLQAQQLVTALTLTAKNIYKGQFANAIQVFGGSLAEIAATHYGNADLGPVLGAANGIFGNRLPPGILTTLQLPPFPVTTQSTSSVGSTASFGTYGS